MSKKMLIDATHPEETRVVVVDGSKVDEFDFEAEARRQLAGNIYLAKVTRVEPSLQAAFVDYGGNRHGFLAFSEIHPDYYQIPVADREALLAEEAALAAAEDEDEKPKPTRTRSRSRSRAKSADKSKDAVAATDPKAEGGEIPGMAVVDLGDETPSDDPLVPMETPEADGPEASAPVAETATSGDAVVVAPEGGGDEAPDTVSGEAAEAAETADKAEVPADTSEATEAPASGDEDDDESDAPYSAMTDAADRDDSIESVADEDVTDEIRRPRKSKLRKYKIQEVIKVRQILLVQVVKEERGNKGAALTTYLSLAGRYCVLMPNTARGGGISRKITNAADRKKLKDIAGGIDVPKGAGLIIRTAGAQRTKTEIKRDYEYLQRMWEQIRELTLKSIAPAKIYEEGDLIKRSIRDLYNRDIDEVWVEGPEGYRTAKDFMKMIMPSHAKNVKQYVDPMPLFARYQVESYLGSMFNPTVQLKSGGYIVIGVTEALVAIDVNSGKATKKGSIEETALETNLEAAEEIARQLRLRDLAGLIVVDFIDMEERKNNASVEKRFKDKLKNDRARIQVGRISGFGLLEMSRQRLRPGMLEATTQPCAACHGTGLIRSDDNLSLGILRQIEEEGVRRRTREVLVKVPIGIANFLMNQKREHIAQIEARYGLSVRIESDMHLIAPDYSIEKFKTQTRVVEQTAPVVSVDASLLVEEEEEAPEAVVEAEEAPAPEAEADDESQPKKRRRRRRRRKKSGSGPDGSDGTETGETTGTEGTATEPQPETVAADAAETGDTVSTAEVSVETSTQESDASVSAEALAPGQADISGDDAAPEAASEAQASETASETAPQPETDLPTQAVEAPSGQDEEPAQVQPNAASQPEEPQTAELAAAPETDHPSTAEDVAEPEPPAPPSEETVVAEPQAAPEPELATETAGSDPAPAKPKRRGWWSVGR